MICGIGIDSVSIRRFDTWEHFSSRQLLKVFTRQELEYCFAYQKKIAERLAVRFAAKEAFFKAGSGFLLQKPLFAILRNVSVCHAAGQKPYLAVNWQALLGIHVLETSHPLRVHLSLTHTEDIATAFVILEQVKKY